MQNILKSSSASSITAVVKGADTVETDNDIVVIVVLSSVVEVISSVSSRQMGIYPSAS